MKETLVKVIDDVQQLQLKRRHVQRRLVFSEPVYSISLKTIATNQTLERTDVFTDKTRAIQDVATIDTHVSEHLSRAGYTHLSDIAATNAEIVRDETSLPTQAIDELIQMSRKERDIPFEQRETVEETVPQQDAIDSLCQNQLWCQLILYEYTIVIWAKKKATQLRAANDITTKEELIRLFTNALENPKSYTFEVAYLTSSSESYVEAVITGRTQEGLSSSERKEILNRDDQQCLLCGSETDLEVHHIIPVSDGGSKDNTNLCTLCADCHFNIAHGGQTAKITYESQEEFWEDIIEREPPDR